MDLSKLTVFGRRAQERNAARDALAALAEGVQPSAAVTAADGTGDESGDRSGGTAAAPAGTPSEAPPATADEPAPAVPAPADGPEPAPAPVAEPEASAARAQSQFPVVEETQRCLDILAACQVQGFGPDMARKFIESHHDVSEVLAQLQTMQARAAGPEIDTHRSEPGATRPASWNRAVEKVNATLG